MSEEIRIVIFTAIITLGSSIITTIVNARIQTRRDKISWKHERSMKVIEYKILAYQEIYSALLAYRDYFLLFVDSANEFKENEDPEKFAPLESNMRLRKAYDKNRLYFSDELQKKIETVLESGEILNNLAVMLCADNPEIIFADFVAPSCENVIENIDKAVKQIKDELDINN